MGRDKYREFKTQLGEGQRENEYEIILIFASDLDGKGKAPSNPQSELILARSQDLPEVGHEVINVNHKGKHTIVAGERMHGEEFNLQLWGGTSKEFQTIYEDIYVWERTLSGYDKEMNPVYNSAGTKRRGMLIVAQPVVENNVKKYINIDVIFGIQPKSNNRPSYNSESGEILSYDIAFTYEMHERLADALGNPLLNDYANDEAMTAILGHFTDKSPDEIVAMLNPVV